MWVMPVFSIASLLYVHARKANGKDVVGSGTAEKKLT